MSTISRLRSTRIVALGLLFAGLSLVAIPKADAALTCKGLAVTITGTPGPDTLNGTPNDDVIHGRGGNDVIKGRGGNDVICGGWGDDKLNGGDGDDILLGAGASDKLYGGAGNDELWGGGGPDSLFGGTGNDVLKGGDHGDSIDAGAGSDTTLAGGGSDKVWGRGGHDDIRAGAGADSVWGGSGNDDVLGGAGNDTLAGWTGRDTLDGGGGADKATGGADYDICLSAKRLDDCEGPEFLETFDGDPAHPTPFGSTADITVSVNSRDASTQDRLYPMQGHHGPNCEPPFATHLVRDYEDALYNCKNHMMTAISSGPVSLGNYAVSMFSPNHLLDFSGGEATIRFDVSTHRASARDWFEVWITPYNDLVRIPVQKDRPSMQGTPRNGVLVALKSFTRIGAPDVKIVRNFGVTDIDGPVEWVGYEQFLTTSATDRSTFEIKISKNHITVGMPDENFYWVSEAIPGGLNFSKGIVQIGHNSYDVFHCDECASGPNTWHWDNISLQPAEPITALPASRRAVNGSGASYVTFTRGAPAGAELKFTGIGFDLEVSYNNGASWLPVVEAHSREIHHWRYKNYSMPIPAGTRRVDFRGDDPYSGHWQIQDISIMSLTPP